MENTKQKLLLTGGSGRLGQLLIPLLEENYIVDAPSSAEFGVAWTTEAIYDLVDYIKPDIIVHCAAITNPMEDHEAGDNYNAGRSIAANIIGTANLAIACEKLMCKMIYISTDYVYPGNEEAPPGGWKESSPLGPVNNYGRSKLGGELAVQMIEDHLILRCAFTPRPFKHKKALVDSIKSPIYIDEAAAIINKMILYGVTGIVNIGGQNRCSLYKWALLQGLTVGQLFGKDLSYKVPVDTSLNITRMNTLLKTGTPDD